MSDQPTVIVIPSTQTDSEQSPTIPLSEIQLSQAEQFGQMKEAFNNLQISHQETQTKVTNLEMQNQELQQQNSTLQAEIMTLNSRQQEQENEEAMPEEVVVITPPEPEPETPTTEEPKKKQSVLNRLLFGKDEDA